MSYLILVGCYIFIGWLFLMDMRLRNTDTRALLVPGIWWGVIASRPISYWIGGNAADSDLEGNPINTFMFGFLILAAIVILQKRNLRWGTVISSNKILFLLYFYFALSAFWSPIGAVSFKRLLKDFGCVIMCLIILTESNPWQAIKTLGTRLAYVTLPLSLVFINYFPAIGRNQSNTGDNMFTGVTLQKNMLGKLIIVFGLIVICDLIDLYRKSDRARYKLHIWIRWLIIANGLLLLMTAQSATAILCVMLGTAGVWVATKVARMPNGRKFITVCVTIFVIVFSLDSSLGVSAELIEAMGRDPTLTGRTIIWEAVLSAHDSRLLGNGFYAFWNTATAAEFIEAQNFVHINQSHNGYIETYLDGGILALVLFALLIITTYRTVVRNMLTGELIYCLAAVFFVLNLFYNYTEAEFFRLGPMWFAFLLFTLRVSADAASIRPTPIGIHFVPGQVAS